jgi:pyruvate,water dikinase
MTAIDSTTVLAPQEGNSHAAAAFPVTWEQPGDEQRCWAHERWGIPGPISPLSFAFADLIYGGMNVAAAAYALPTRVVARRINTFLYMAEDASTSPADAAEHGQRSEQLLDAALTALGERWEGDWLPEVQRHLAWWEGFDLSGSSTPALLDHLDETVTRMRRLWEIHFLLFMPLVLAISEFDELYRELMGSAGHFDSYRLLQGFDNRTVDGGRALWDLSRRALGAPPVRSALQDSEPAGVLAALAASPEGVAFLAELRAYLAEYGQRSNNPLELSEPSWIEDPTPVIATLREYLEQPDRDVAAERAALVAERERAIVAVRARLAGYPRPVVKRWESLLRAAQEATVLSEDHAFWIDLCGLYQARRIIVEIGRRLADAGAITVADDVFYLTLDEVREALDGRPPRNALALLAARKAEMEYFRTITPPYTLGSAPPESQADDALSRAMAKFMGVAAPATTEPGVVLGSAGSPGIVRGTAKVVLSLADAGKLQPGDILVAEYTAPQWTPLFGIAAALVTDFGGVLSHCAIVAREFGIPAVVGTGSATTTLVDGQLIEVDGDQGIVRIVANP